MRLLVLKKVFRPVFERKILLCIDTFFFKKPVRYGSACLTVRQLISFFRYFHLFKAYGFLELFSILCQSPDIKHIFPILKRYVAKYNRSISVILFCNLLRRQFRIFYFIISPKQYRFPCKIPSPVTAVIGMLRMLIMAHPDSIRSYFIDQFKILVNFLVRYR